MAKPAKQLSITEELERLIADLEKSGDSAATREEIDRLADSLARILGAESAAEPGAAVGGTAGRKA